MMHTALHLHLHLHHGNTTPTYASRPPHSNGVGPWRSRQKWPAGHVSHVDAPPVLYEPAVQGSQVVEPATGANVPGAHAMHGPPGSDQWPAGHLVHVGELAGDDVPAGHVWHTSDALPE